MTLPADLAILNTLECPIDSCTLLLIKGYENPHFIYDTLDPIKVVQSLLNS